MLDKKEAIIFDLDGSLVDSMWVWTELDHRYMEKYKVGPVHEFQKEIEGMSFTETAQFFIEKFPQLNFTPEAVMDEWREMIIELYAHEVQLKPGAGAFLQQMREKKMPMGIATSNDREIVDVILHALHIQHYFSSIATACEVGAGKPAPDVYLKVADDLQIDPAKCLVFEDIPAGIMAGKNAGMSVCAVEDDFSKSDEQVKKNLADYCIHDYYDIANHTYEVCLHSTK